MKFQEMIIVWILNIQSKKKKAQKHLNIFRNNNSVESGYSDWNYFEDLIEGLLDNKLLTSLLILTPPMMYLHVYFTDEIEMPKNLDKLLKVTQPMVAFLQLGSH